jgi:hypothetical protein
MESNFFLAEGIVFLLLSRLLLLFAIQTLEDMLYNVAVRYRCTIDMNRFGR